MARLRTVPPAAFGGVPVTSAIDLARGEGELPPADVLTYRLEGARVVVRPSGTEPKIKAYLEVVETSRTGTSRPLAPMPAIGSARCEALSPPCSALRRFHDRGSFVALVPDKLPRNCSWFGAYCI